MKKHSLIKRLSVAVVPALALLLNGAVSPTFGQPKDPTGDWDFSFSGAEKGVAQITFVGDFTLNGSQIFCKPIKILPDNPRGTPFDNDDPRGGTPTGTNSSSFGGSDIIGIWGYDSKGKVIGSMIFLSDNRTNGMSFKGSVVPGRRFSINGANENGKIAFSGVPRVALPDISGTFYAAGKKGGKTHVEMLSFSPGTGLNAGLNKYDLTSFGPGFVGLGHAMITSNKKMGIYYEFGDTTPPGIVAMSGNFNTNSFKGSLTGTDGTNNISVRVGPTP
jgi:hypothetical protein